MVHQAICRLDREPAAIGLLACNAMASRRSSTRRVRYVAAHVEVISRSKLASMSRAHPEVNAG
jgi:hypothetical protein